MKAKIALVVFLLFLFCFSFAKSTFAAVVINEVSPATSPEWVEIYNTSPEAVSLHGYIIDFGSVSQKKSFCDGEEIVGKSYKLINLTVPWLNNDGDTVTLKNDSGTVDSISYGPGSSLENPKNSESITRFPDGSSNWILTKTPTQQGNSVSFVCPTQTPTPTNSPTPTDSPAPVPTSKPTPTKSPTKTLATPTSTQKTLSSIPSRGQILSAATNSKINIPTSVLGQSTKSADATPSAVDTKSNKEVKTLGRSQNNIFRILIVIGIAIFVFSCVILLFQYFKNKNIDNE